MNELIEDIAITSLIIALLILIPIIVTSPLNKNSAAGEEDD